MTQRVDVSELFIYPHRMKPESMRIAFLVFFAALTSLFVVITWPFAKAAFLAFTLAVIFFPFFRFVQIKIHLPKYLTSIITTLCIGLCVILPFIVVLAVVTTQIGHFLQAVVAQTEGGSFTETIQPILTTVHGWITWVTGTAPAPAELQGALLTVLKEAGKKFYEFSPKVLATTLSLAANFLLVILFLVVFFAEGSELYDWFMETAPLSSEHRKELAHDVRLTITSSIAAALLTALVQGVLLGVGFWVAGFNHPYSWGLIAILLSIVPVLGASSCYVVASIVLFANGNVQGAVIFLLYGLIVVSSIDNVIKPLVIKSSSRMHPLLLFVTLIGAAKLLGPIGLIVGPVLLSIFLASLRIYRREFASIG